MWDVNGMPQETSLFRQFEPIDVLIWYDCPRTFTLQDENGELCLAHWLDEDSELMRYLVVPVTANTIDKLVRGELSIRYLFDSNNSEIQTRAYVLDQANDGEVCRVWLVRIKDLPQEVLPRS